MKQLPKLNLFYWLFLISANTMGETAGDLISQTFKLGYGGGTIALAVLFVLALSLSLNSKSQQPILYWTCLLYTSPSPRDES
jgi:uncharacterized membrane-anchored protein